jgi:hypothetical protein
VRISDTQTESTPVASGVACQGPIWIERIERMQPGFQLTATIADQPHILVAEHDVASTRAPKRHPKTRVSIELISCAIVEGDELSLRSTKPASEKARAHLPVLFVTAHQRADGEEMGIRQAL